MTKTLPQPAVGITSVSGRVVIAYTPSALREGEVPNGVAIAIDANPTTHDRYVVWTVFTHDGGSNWGAEQGDYCSTISQAVRFYNERGGK